jgi:hypothetical protein
MTLTTTPADADLHLVGVPISIMLRHCVHTRAHVRWILAPEKDAHGGRDIDDVSARDAAGYCLCFLLCSGCWRVDARGRGCGCRGARTSFVSGLALAVAASCQPRRPSRKGK